MKVLSNWRSVRLWETQLERDLHRRHHLRTHGLLIGTGTLLLMWLAAHLLRSAGLDSLALRYAVTLGVGYIGYLLVLRGWAGRLVRQDTRFDLDVPDLPDLPGSRALASSSTGVQPPSGAGTGGGSGLLDAGALDIGGVDEGAVVVIPVLVVFLIGSAIVFGAGALVLLYFGSEALLAVALELAFSYVSARAAVRVARAGWMGAAVRLTWKPLLGALLCAVLLGGLIDAFMPDVDSLPQAVRVLLHR